MLKATNKSHNEVVLWKVFIEREVGIGTLLRLIKIVPHIIEHLYNSPIHDRNLHSIEYQLLDLLDLPQSTKLMSVS